MVKLIKRIIMYYKGREIWNAKMSEHLKVRIITTPQENKTPSQDGHGKKE